MAGMTDDTSDVWSLTPQQATDRLAALQREHDGAQPAPPEKPSNATEAKARLDHLVRDGEWSKKLDAGDADTHKEFHALTALAADLPAGDRFDAALRGEVPPGLIETTDGSNKLTTHKLASAVEGLREVGLSDDVIRQAVNGGKDDPAVLRALAEFRDKLFGDPAWTKRYLDGGAVERRQATLIAIALNSEVAE
jgi:hypothetical protein